MSSTSQSLDLHEQDGKEVARQATSDKIVALPPRINHSTLEARDPNPVLYDSFKQATCIHSQPRSLSSDGKVLATQKAAEEAPYQVSKGGRRRCGLQPKWFWLIVMSAAAAIAIIIGAVVGTIVHRDKGIDKQTSSSNSTGQLVPTNSSHPASIVPTNSSHPASVVKMNVDTALASIAWNDVDNNPQYRLYWQGEDSTIRESSRNGTQQNWTVSSSPIGYARPNSPMAAVVTGPAGFPFVSGGLSANESYFLTLFLANKPIHDQCAKFLD